MNTNVTDIKDSEVLDNLSTIAKSEAMINNNMLIRSDMGYAIKDFDDFSSSDMTGNYYVAIRQKGVENSTSRKYIDNRLAILGKAHIFITITRKENGMCDMKIERA